MIVRIHRSPLTTHHSQRRGLSLLEVLLALTIFLFSLVAIGQLIDIGNGDAMDISWLGRASLLAQSRLAEVLAGSIPLSSQSEVSCQEDSDYTWSIDADPDNAPGLYRVKITVGRTRSDGSKFETVVNQMVLDPNYRGAADGSDGVALATPPATTAAATTGTTGTGTTGTGTTGTGSTGTTKTGGN